MTTRLLKSPENINGLPIGFQEVEYLESTGTQYIDTGITINTATDEVEIYFQLISTTLYQWLMGEHDNGARFGIGVGDGTNKRNIAYGATTYKVNDTQVYNSIHKFVANSNGVYVDGVQVHAFESFSSTSTIYLFNLNISGGAGLASGKIWTYRHKRNGVLIRDFIPALNPAGRPCMYDLVGKKAYYNLGSGEFTYGRKIIPVEFLESTGTQYIDTGYVPKPTSTYKSTFQLTNITTTAGAWFCVFGSVESNNSTFTELFLPRVSGDGDVNQILAGSHNSTYLRTDYPWAVNTKYTFEMTPTSVLVNEISQGSISVNSSITCSHSIYLFARHEYNDAVRYNVSAKIHSFTIYEGNTLVRDYIPCIDENGVGYMFDKVTHTCYLNAGTGTFNYGKKLYSSKVRLYKDSEANKLPIGFKRVEYLESTGTQFILTGFTPTLNTDFEIELSSTSTGQNRWAIGCPTWVGVHYKGATNEVGVTNSSTAAFQQYTPYNHDNSRLTMKLSGDTVYANGVSLGTITRRAGTLDFALFGYRDANAGATLFFIGSIYKTKIWDNNTIVHNFIPALDTTNTPCMYDTVTQTAFYNQGTGQFTYGAVIPNKVRLPQSTEIRFPKGYTEVEYLASNGNQYIDTEVLGNGEFDVDYQYYQTENSSNAIFAGTRSASQHLNFGQRSNGSTGAFSMAYLGEYWQAISSPAINTNIRVQISYKSGSQTGTLNGTAMTSKSLTGTEATNLSIYLFKRHHYGTDNVSGLVGRIYYFKLWNNGALVRYFIPALDPNGRPCMWDAITKKPYYNQGTGEFTYGRSIQQVSYLESSGTQYIDTGYKPNNNTEYEVRGYMSPSGVFGVARWSGDPQYDTFGAHSIVANALDYYGRYSNNKYLEVTSNVFNKPIIWKHTKDRIVIKGLDNTTYVDQPIITDSFQSTYNMWVFGFNNMGTLLSRSVGCKINIFKIYDNSILIRDFIPAIDSNNVGFMFDRVTHTIYDNAGSGSFTYGSNIRNNLRS